MLPRSRVDIIAKVRHIDKSVHSQVLLQNVLVLDIDRKRLHAEGSKTPVATVALTQEDILKVMQAGEYGPLTLVVRSYP
jgi:Flp pilus assembly protein CpaB